MYRFPPVKVGGESNEISEIDEGGGVTCVHVSEGATTHSDPHIPPAKVPGLLLPNMVNSRGAGVAHSLRLRQEEEAGGCENS